MANPLHDNARSKTEKKADDKKPEEKPDEKAAIEKKAAEKPKEPEGEDADGAEGEAAASPKDAFMDGMKNMKKRHEGELRDAHGNHREMLRQMAARHGKEIADHFDMHMPNEAAPAAPAAGAGDAGAEPAAEE